jgi:alpha-glucuronidase
MNRTAATGTGYIGQYSPPVAAVFESLDTCPDDLLLFMHHVPYTHVLHNGKTVIQHFYDEHYQGVVDAQELVNDWKSLDGLVDEQRFDEVLARQEFQAGHAQVWRDAICNWFMKRSGIPDDHGRVGNYPNRVEAEELELIGYEVTDIEPWEAASGSKAIELPNGVDEGRASHRFEGPAGWHKLRIQFFDEEDGASTFKLFIADQIVDQWQADRHVPTPTNSPDSHSSTQHTVGRLALRPGDEIRIESVADHGERAVIDYIEVEPIDQ